MQRLAPIVSFKDEEYVLMTSELAGIAVHRLGPLAGNVSGERETVLAALDFLVTGF